MEEQLWLGNYKSRELCLKGGGKNVKYFRSCTVTVKKINKIKRIKSSEGSLLTSREDFYRTKNKKVEWR